MNTLFISVLLVLTSISTPLQDSTDDQIKALDSLVKDLAALTKNQETTDAAELSENFQQRIDLANDILEHPDIEEGQRVLAELTKLQAFGVLYSIAQREKADDEELLEKYQAQIEKLLTDSNERISLEAVSANANLAISLYVKEPGAETSGPAVDALNRLVSIAPKDPIIQTTKRLLLERVWDADEPKELFQALADANDDAAKIVLPSLNDDDESSRQVAKFKWARYFSKFNDFVAMNRLARMYEEGVGTRANNTQAARWYEKLARLGDLNSMTKLGDFYLEGKGYSVNPKTAVEYYQKAATAGYRVAQFKLGECYLKGQGVEANKENWRKWIKSAAFNASNVEVQQLYESVDFKTAPDSFQVFYAVLVDENPNDIYYLNNFAYSLLLGAEKEPEKSLELIDKAIATAPENFDGMPNFLDTKAHALKNLGKFKEAAEVFESVLDEVDDKKPVLEALVECYTEIDETKAKQYRQELSELSDK